MSHSSNDIRQKDKRLLAFEGEFSQVLQVIRRDGNTISALLRNLWDFGAASTLTRKNPIKVKDAHFSMIGHITAPELNSGLSDVAQSNGFANRILWIFVSRSKSLPHGSSPEQHLYKKLAQKIKRQIKKYKGATNFELSKEAKVFWESIYDEISEGGEDAVSLILGRGEPYIRRLAIIYAILDGSDCIDLPHIKASYAIWQYNVKSAYIIFGQSLGSPLADKIFAIVKSSPDGVTRTTIRDSLGRNSHKNEVDQAIHTLRCMGLIRRTLEKGKGRPTETWFLKES